MPYYEYICPNCRKYVLIEKPMSMVSQPERCSCGTGMRRKYSLPMINFNRWNPDYRHNEPIDGNVDFIAEGGDEIYREHMHMTPKEVEDYDKAVRAGEVDY